MASDPNLLAGQASVTIDGRSSLIVGEGTYRPSTSKRETLLGQDGVHGYSQMPQAGMIKWKGRDMGSLSVKDLNEATNVTVVLVLANGKNVVGRNMWRVGDPVEVNTEDGSFEVQFESADVSELAA